MESASQQREVRIDLPYGLWRGEHPLRPVLVRPLGGWDELRISEAVEAGLSAVRIATDTLARCVICDGAALGHANAAALVIGDREVLLRAIYAITVTPKISAVAHCAAGCGGAAEFDVDLPSLIRKPPEAGPVHRLRLGRKRISIRLPTGADVERVLGMGTEAEQLLADCVAEKVDSLALVAAAIERLDPNAECEIAVPCQECGALIQLYLDGFALLRAAVMAHGGIFRQIDHLARTYGWSEDEILALPRARRLRYCAMADEEVAR
ncbi:MAG: hypothetical protein M3Q19_06335 [Pseudomonadota bacterium]|nr:hypothetical protein [Pseudomonadota bacterium]